jgi:putative nucleotidyltransferase with HDIG domain
MVEALVAALVGESDQIPPALGATGGDAVARNRPTRRSPSGSRPDLMSAIAELNVVPAFAPAYERVLALTATDSIVRGELVETVEGDTGLTIAVLRRAQSVAVRRPIANVADAVAALSATEIADAIKALPRAEFPWRTSPLEVLMHRFRVHAQAVARAADRISRDAEQVQRDEVIVAALLHDIGKLVLGRALREYTGATEKTTTPEERARHERRAWGTDHASIGGLLLSRWGLPKRLASTVATHHSSEADHEVATYVRLADMIVHHAQGEPVDRVKMLRLSGAGCPPTSSGTSFSICPTQAEANAVAPNHRLSHAARPLSFASWLKARFPR